jgi:RhtB (resistance to homoserine/threonine) family protein
MGTYLTEFLTVAGIHLLAVMSPGPDFVLISRNSLVYSRRTGIFSALGLALGIIVHITYSLIGIGFIIAKSIVAFSIIKYLGAGYLIYIGYKSLRAKPKPAFETESFEQLPMSNLQAVKNGFLTNVLNPKVTLFFLALFTQVIHQTTPASIKILYGLEMSAMTFTWFSAVSLVLSHNKVRAPFRKIQHYVERVMGAALIILGLKVALSRR